MVKRVEKFKIIQNKKALYFVIILLIILVVLIVCLMKLQKKENNLNECTSDSDCVLQQTTCCSCNMGGKQECVSKQNVSLIQNEIAKCAKNLKCIAMYNCQEILCKCIDNKCVG